MVEIKPVPAKMIAATAIDIIIRGDLRIQVQKGFDAKLLAETIRALEGLP